MLKIFLKKKGLFWVFLIQWIKFKTTLKKSTKMMEEKIRLKIIFKI